MLLNFFITLFVVTLILVPWGVGLKTCENFDQSVLDPQQSVLDGCNRPSNLSVCDGECVAKSDSCWLDYRLSVLTTIANHSKDPLMLIQVCLDNFSIDTFHFIENIHSPVEF